MNKIKDVVYSDRYNYRYKKDAFGDDGCRYLFGEELIDYKIVPYRGRISDIKDFEHFAQEFEDAYIMVSIEYVGDMKKVPCKLLEQKKRVYLTEMQFNAYWKLISDGISKGLMLHSQNMAQGLHLYNNTEQYVDLSFYETDTKSAVIKNYKIAIIGKQADDRLRILAAKRASAMDNKKLLFVYSASDRIVHDKSCDLVRQISDKDFRACETLPKQTVLCDKCKLKMSIRKAVGDDFRRYAAYERMFEKGKVCYEDIDELISGYHAKLHMEGPNIMEVSCNDDTWKIVLDEDDTFSLLHNNYVMVSDTERYISGGYHLQKYHPYALTDIIRYIETYNWQIHLEAKRAKQAEKMLFCHPNKTAVWSMVSPDSHQSNS